MYFGCLTFFFGNIRCQVLTPFNLEGGQGGEVSIILKFGGPVIFIKLGIPDLILPYLGGVSVFYPKKKNHK